MMIHKVVEKKKLKKKKGKKIRRFYWMGYVPDEDQLDMNGEYYLGDNVSVSPYYLVDRDGNQVDDEGYIYPEWEGEDGEKEDRPYGILVSAKVIIGADEDEEGAAQSWP